MKDISEVCFIIQARLSSERVPRKMMKPFAGTSLVEIACKKINQSKVIPRENFFFSAYEDEIKNVVKNNNLQLFHRSKESAFSEGPMQQVMEYHDKLDFKYSVVISACCPLLSVETIDSFVNQYLASPNDGLFGVIEKKNYLNEVCNKHGIEWDQIDEWPTFAKYKKEFAKIKEQAHADYVLRPIENYGHRIDVVLEAKAKELALFKYRDIYAKKKKDKVSYER